MIKEIKNEIIYVGTLLVIIAWFFMILDIKQRIESYNFIQNWEYNINVPVPNGVDKAMFKEPKYKPKHRMKNKV